MTRANPTKNIPIGQRFGKLTVNGSAFLRQAGRNKSTFVPCICECGTEVVKKLKYLNSGNVRSCGCLQAEQGKINLTHAWAAKRKVKCKKIQRPPEFKVWRGMKKRCYDPTDKFFHRYGGRGITICERWLHPFPPKETASL